MQARPRPPRSSTPTNPTSSPNLKKKQKQEDKPATPTASFSITPVILPLTLALLFATTFTLYVLTLCPSLPSGDSAEFIGVGVFLKI